MPLYALKCLCGKCFEQFAPASDRWQIACPACGSKEVPTDLQATFPPRRMANAWDGVESIAYGFHPGEVLEARKRLPNWDIRDDGVVTYRSKRHAEQCGREWAEKNLTGIRTGK